MVVERSNVRKWSKMKPMLAVLVSHFASNQSHSPLTLIGKGRVYGNSPSPPAQPPMTRPQSSSSAITLEHLYMQGRIQDFF